MTDVSGPIPEWNHKNADISIESLGRMIFYWICVSLIGVFGGSKFRFGYIQSTITWNSGASMHWLFSDTMKLLNTVRLV